MTDCFAALAMTAFLTGGERGMSVLRDAKNDELPLAGFALRGFESEYPLLIILT